MFDVPSQIETSPERLREALLSEPHFQNLYALTAFVGVLVIGDLVLWATGLDAYRSVGGFRLVTIAAMVGGGRFLYHAVLDLLEGRLGTDVALALAIIAALILNETWVAAEVVFIALVGETLEAITFRRTQQSLYRLLELQPLRVRVQRGDSSDEVPLDEVRAGDVAIVRPGERVPADGVVLAGRSSVDQSTFTGESLPSDKQPGDEVYAGTLNQLGMLEVRVSRVGAHSALGQVLQVVAAARRNKSRVERLADELTRYFLPMVMALAGVTFALTNADAIWPLLSGSPGTVPRWEWMPTLSVLVVTCPCALVLATPAAMLAAFSSLARRGMVVRGGVVLERLARVSAMAFDKTGTLTAGELRLVECRGVDGHDADRVLQVAASAEQGSEHLIARAILTSAREQQRVLTPLAESQVLPGAGVLARPVSSVDAEAGFPWVVGNRRLHAEHQAVISAEADRVIEEYESRGLTTLLVSERGRVLGIIAVGDHVRPEARAILAELRQLGITETALLSGDRPQAVRDVARAVGIERFHAEMRPVDKANWIADWSGGESPENQGAHSVRPRREVAMVGDGVNDAPALATADVGIALRGIGSEIAAEAGDVVLLGEPLACLPHLVRLSRETVRVIRQNIVVFAFLMNLLGVAVTAWWMPSWSAAWRPWSPVAAAIYHQGASVLVLLNALRLLWFERWRASWLGRAEDLVGNGLIAAWQRATPIWRGAVQLWPWRAVWGRLAAWCVVLLYLTQIVVFVAPDEVAVVRRCGRFHAILAPGPHLRLPPPFDWITREQPARVRALEIGLRRANLGGVTAVEWNSLHDPAAASGADGIVNGNAASDNLVLTGDRSLVELAVTIQYRVGDLRAFRFGVRDPEQVLRAVCESAVREVVGERSSLVRAGQLDAERELLASGRGAAQRDMESLLQQRVDQLGLGVEILAGGVCFQDVHPPLAVVDAFRDVSAAFKQREQMKNEADAYYREQLIRAGGARAWQSLAGGSAELSDGQWSALRETLTGDAFGELKAAEAFAELQTAVAGGDAQSFLDQNAARAADPALTEWRLLMETVESTLAGRQKIVLDPHGKGRRHLLLGLPAAAPVPTVPLLQPNVDDEG
ncbi:MAG: cation-translocating P-type ATPase family protein [Pirellulaceae bacterium]